MKPIILPAALLFLGLGGGVGAAYILPQPTTATDCAATPEHNVAAETPPEPETPREYARLNNQFVVPVIGDGRIRSLMSLGLTIEVPQGTQADVFAVEPRLRDSFLQVMFDHANLGGFDGDFTASTPMRSLRSGLLAAAHEVLGDGVSDVLILDITRQDL